MHKSSVWNLYVRTDTTLMSFWLATRSKLSIYMLIIFEAKIHMFTVDVCVGRRQRYVRAATCVRVVSINMGDEYEYEYECKYRGCYLKTNWQKRFHFHFFHFLAFVVCRLVVVVVLVRARARARIKILNYRTWANDRTQSPSWVINDKL